MEKIIEKIILAPETCNKCDNMIPHYYYFVRRYLYLHSLFGINQCFVKVILLSVVGASLVTVRKKLGLREAIWDESEIWLIDGSSVLVDEALLRERRCFRFEAEFSSIHRSTSTSTSAPLEDGLPSLLRSEVACMTGRRLRARLAQWQGRSAEQPTSEERKGVAHSC